jgi:hypothetical protein
VTAQRGSPKLTAARRRSARAKTAIATGGVLAFGAALALAHSSYASHAKHRARPLTAPATFVDTVHSDLLRAGVVAPPTAPPEAQTSTS